jgi:hypothetical protein
MTFTGVIFANQNVDFGVVIPDKTIEDTKIFKL